MADDSSAPTRATVVRTPTGIPGLDEVLRGGLLRGGSYLVLGEPGTGKTTLGNHVAYRHAADGGVALYATVLAEAHDRMLLHLRDLDFFAPELVGAGVRYLSLFDDLRDRGLEAGLAALRRLVTEARATLLVIDGAARFEDFAASRAEYRRFSAELHAQLALLGCTTLLLAQPALDADPMHALGTHVDGIVLLEDRVVDATATRRLLVPKLRGMDVLRGHHEFAITGAGVEVYPRLEAALVPARADRLPRQRRMPLGIDGLDTVLLGGVLTGSSTLVVGPPGIGKTTVGLQFVAEGAERGERGLIAGFQEAPERLVAKAEGLGLHLAGHAEADRVRFLWQPSADRPLDAWAGELLGAIAEHRPQRLVIDALTDVARLPASPGRLPAFTAALVGALRGRGATTLLTAEMPTVEGTGLDIPLPETAATIDNAILLRYVEPRSRLHRLVSVLRVRESGFDPGVREFSITDRGIEVDPTTAGADAILTDAPDRRDHPIAAPATRVRREATVARILVVDDEPAIRALLLELLEAEGYAAVGAPNGRVAVELAARERPDLVLSDVMMPELDGPGMVRSLRAAPELADVPIVLMSAANGALPAEPTVTAFIPKPFDLDDLLAIVARALGDGRS